MLATEDGLLLGHLSLDEGVAHTRAHGLAAVFRDELRHRLRGDEVVDDRRTREFLEVALRDERADRRGAHRVALLVHDEAAVRVTVEGQSDIGALLDDELLQVDEILRIQWVGLVIGERAVELEVERA